MNQVTLLFPNSECFKYKTSITRNTYNVGAGEAGYDANKVSKNETEVVIPLKQSSNFWGTSNTPLINCDIELILTCSKNCALANMTVTVAGNHNDPLTVVALTRLEFEMADKKLHDLIITLSKANVKKLLE